MADNIPIDIVRMIFRHLCVVDQIRFRGVCRRWRNVGDVRPRWLFIYKDTVIDKDKHDPETMFMLVLNREWIRYKDADSSGYVERSDSGVWSYLMYDSSTGKAHPYHVALPNTCRSHESHSPADFRIVATHSGWLLMESNCGSEKSFLYNPFTRSAIFLPTQAMLPSVWKFLKHPKYAFKYCHVKQRFTVYVVWTENGKVVVNTWRTSDVAWKTDELIGVNDNTSFFFTTPARVRASDGTGKGSPMLFDLLRRYYPDHHLSSLKTFWIETPTL